MEALAVFSVACNVMQVIQFSRDTASICKRLNQDKSPAPEIAYNGEALRTASQDLKTSLTFISPGSLQPDERELQLVASKVVVIADQLRKELEKCQAKSGSSKIVALGKALKYSWSRKKRIEDISQSLGSLQNMMQTRILLNIRYGWPALYLSKLAILINT